MSYQQAYGQPQAQMAQQLPFPVNQLIAQPFQVPPGQPPFMPQPMYLPPFIQQFYPFVVSCAMDAIMAKCQQGPLRVFMFNQMVNNGWQNKEFIDFLDLLIRLTEVNMASRRFGSPDQAIAALAPFVAELATAANVTTYQALLSTIDQPTTQGVQQVLGNLQITMREINAFYASQPQQQVGQPMWQQQPVVQQQQPAWRGVAQVQQQQPAWQQVRQPAQPGSAANWRDSAAQAGQPGAVPSSGLFSQGTVAAVAAPAVDPMIARFEQSGRSPTKPAGHVENIQAVAVPAAAPAVRYVSPTGKEIEAKDGKWVPSELTPVNIAINPNTTKLFYDIQSDGSTKPVVKAKDQREMDKNKHLATPSFVAFAPIGSKSLDSKVRAFDTTRSLSEEEKQLKQAGASMVLQEEHQDSKAALPSGLSLAELWINNEVRLALMKKREQETNVYRSRGVLQDVLVCMKNPKPMILNISQAPSFAAAVKIMRDYERQIEEGTCQHGDVKALTHINARLTARFNHFIKHTLALPAGSIDSFMEDAPAVPAFLSEKYGETFAQPLVKLQSQIIAQALQFAGKKFEDDQNANLEPSEEIDRILATVDITYFYDDVSLTSLDLYAHELEFDLPPKVEVSVGVFATQTPLLRQIAENVLTYARATQVNFSHHFVRTADGVCLEITRSEINPDFYLVCRATK